MNGHMKAVRNKSINVADALDSLELMLSQVVDALQAIRLCEDTAMSPNRRDALMLGVIAIVQQAEEPLEMIDGYIANVTTSAAPSLRAAA